MKLNFTGPDSVPSEVTRTWNQESQACYLSSLGKIRLGDFGLLVINRIFYYGVVIDVVFQTCKNSRTYRYIFQLKENQKG